MDARPSSAWPAAEDSSEPPSAQSETKRFCHGLALAQGSGKKTGPRRRATRRRNVSVRRSTALNRSEDESQRRWLPSILLRRQKPPSQPDLRRERVAESKHGGRWISTRCDVGEKSLPPRNSACPDKNQDGPAYRRQMRGRFFRWLRT